VRGDHRDRRETWRESGKAGGYNRAIPESVDDITTLLVAWGQGDEAALQQLIPLVHRELHQIAGRCLKRERPGHTLQPTALVNEAYLRLIDVRRVDWKNRTHFLAMSARLMRRVLVDFARSRQYQKRGGGVMRVSLDEAHRVSTERGQDLVALDEALSALSAIDERKARVIELRFFGGLTVEETAEVLDVSRDTVLRDWRLARAWLMQELLKSASRPT
jgi:RNA polymerase sigma factor (TIGR02999 family)